MTRPTNDEYNKANQRSEKSWFTKGVDRIINEMSNNDRNMTPEEAENTKRYLSDPEYRKRVQSEQQLKQENRKVKYQIENKMAEEFDEVAREGGMRRTFTGWYDPETKTNYDIYGNER